MGFFSSDEQKEIKSDGVVTNNLVLDNELKTTNNDVEFYLKLITIIGLAFFLYTIVKNLMKAAKRTQLRDTIMLENRANSA